MKKIIGLFLTLSNLASADTALLYDLECSNGKSLVTVKVEKESLVEYKDAYDLEIKKAKASVTVTNEKSKYSYSKNIFVMPEGNGNFRLRAYSVDDSVEMVEVASIYYEHEGNYIVGNIKQPILDGEKIFVNDLSFNEMNCK